MSYGERDVSQKNFSMSQMSNVFVPIEIKFNGKLIAAALGKFEFTGINWVLEDESKFYTSETKLDEKVEQAINQEGNRNMIIKFFENMEKYGIKFENSQKRMLVAPGNTLALGRSGTGKTTVSAFKMLAIDLLFKAYSKARLNGDGNVQLEPKDLSIYSGCGIVFCTASPVLTNEVRRYYEDINIQIKEFLAKKMKQRKDKENEKNKENDDVDVVEMSQANEETKQVFDPLYNINQYILGCKQPR